MEDKFEQAKKQLELFKKNAPIAKPTGPNSGSKTFKPNKSGAKTAKKNKK